MALALFWCRFSASMVSYNNLLTDLTQFFTNKEVAISSSFVLVGSLLIAIVYSCTLGIAFFFCYFGGIVFFQIILQREESAPNVFFMLKRRERIVSRSEVPRSCTICGDSKCRRHKADFNLYNLQPWAELKLPQEVDQALEELLTTVLDKHIYEWYRLISKDDCFVHELRVCLRFFVAVFIRRSMKVDLTNVILDRLVKTGIQHLDCCLQAQRIAGNSQREEENVLQCYGSNLHIALHSRKNELKYLRHLCRCLLQYILPKKYLKCKSVCKLVPEILCSTVLLPAMDIVADPYTINRLLILFFEKGSMTKYPDSNSPWVEVLANFVETKIPSRSSTLQLPMSRILSNQTLLYPFMQFMKEEAAINVLQFCLTVEDFNRKILNPDLTNGELIVLQTEARQIYDTYCSPDAVDRVQLDRCNVEEIREIVYGKPEDIIQLRCRPPLFKCYDQAFILLEKTFWPLFHQSDNYFTYLCGSRLNEKNGKGSNRSPKKELSAVAKIGNKLTKIKDVFKTSAVEGRAYDDSSASEASEPNFDEITKVEDVENAISREMSAWRVSIPKTESLLERGYKLCYVYFIELQDIDVRKNDDPNSHHWFVRRRYHEFYVLETKLLEFHGDLEDACLPVKKGHTGKGFDFMESRRKLFETFLQKLLTIPTLRTSELLFRFLNPGEEFTMALFPDINLGKMIKTMPMKLLKEKGQHLDSFLQIFVQSTEAAKPRPSNLECRDISTDSHMSNFLDRIQKTIYRDNASRAEDIQIMDTSRPRLELQLHGVYDYILYLVIRVFDVPSWFLQILMAIRTVAQNTVETMVKWYVDTKLEQALVPQRIAFLLRLLKVTIYDSDSKAATELDKIQVCDEALNKFRGSVISVLVYLTGHQKFMNGTETIFKYLQYSRLNKQLSYAILDIIIMELFPELTWPSRASFSDS